MAPHILSVRYIRVAGNRKKKRSFQSTSRLAEIRIQPWALGNRYDFGMSCRLNSCSSGYKLLKTFLQYTIYLLYAFLIFYLSPFSLLCPPNHSSQHVSCCKMGACVLYSTPHGVRGTNKKHDLKMCSVTNRVTVYRIPGWRE